MGKNETITSDATKFLKGIFQRDSLSVLLFILTVNPLPFMLRNIKGYSYGIERTNDITHNFFVDDLKLYASNINIKKQSDLVTAFTKDTGMTFEEDKCAYQQVENGKLIKNTEDLKMNNLDIKPIKDGNTYKHLGIDRNISYAGTVNKERVMKEYLIRVKKIWKSELSSFNKVITHNTFDIPVLTTTIGIRDKRDKIKEIKEIDVKTRK